MEDESVPWGKAAREEHERFMADHDARWAKVYEAIELRQREWVRLAQVVAELQARRGYWRRLFGLP